MKHFPKANCSARHHVYINFIAAFTSIGLSSGLSFADETNIPEIKIEKNIKFWEICPSDKAGSVIWARCEQQQRLGFCKRSQKFPSFPSGDAPPSPPREGCVDFVGIDDVIRNAIKDYSKWLAGERTKEASAMKLRQDGLNDTLAKIQSSSREPDLLQQLGQALTRIDQLERRLQQLETGGVKK